jgi:hypothetical protein
MTSHSRAMDKRSRILSAVFRYSAIELFLANLVYEYAVSATTVITKATMTIFATINRMISWERDYD